MLSTSSFGDLINPLFLVAFGVALGGLVLFLNMIMNVASRIKNMIFFSAWYSWCRRGWAGQRGYQNILIGIFWVWLTGLR